MLRKTGADHGRDGGPLLLLGALGVALAAEGGRNIAVGAAEAGQAAQSPGQGALLEGSESLGHVLVGEPIRQARPNTTRAPVAGYGFGIGPVTRRLGGRAARVAAGALLLRHLPALGCLGRSAAHTRREPGDVAQAAAEQLLHLLLALEEVLDKGAHLSGGDAGAAGDPRAP